jgi:glyoxylase-like metal-dependent hydrolase (beta-lactamase superfamily II)
MTGSWFATRQLEPGIHLIAEPVHVNSYLVQGRRRAVLIDTGLGISDIRTVVEELTGLQVLVVNTHYHFDHSGGNHLFEEIAIHREGEKQLQERVPEEILRRYMSYTSDLLEAFGVYKDLDDRFFHFLTEETSPRPLPDGFKATEWSYVPKAPTQLLEEGDVLNLGGRELRVLHTPGHTPDCICLLDERDGVLFGGDTINTGPIYSQLPDSDISLFASSTRRLARELEGSLRVVYVPHFVRYAADPPLLGEIADGFEAVVAGNVRWHRSYDCVGFSVKEARFGRFSIFVPDEEAEEATPLLSASSTYGFA